MIKKNCILCKKDFISKVLDKRKYCSRECYYKSLPNINKSKRIRRECAWCGKEIFLVPSTLHIKSCSNKCANNLNWSKPEVIEKQIKSHTGKKQTFEHIQKTRQKLLGRIFTDEWKKKISISKLGNKGGSKETNKAGRENYIPKRKGTNIENIMEKILKYDLQIIYIKQRYMRKIKLPYSVDFYLPDSRIIIECDGDYWHNYPVGRDIDKQRTEQLTELGYKVLRFWGSEIINSKGSCRTIIELELKNAIEKKTNPEGDKKNNLGNV